MKHKMAPRCSQHRCERTTPLTNVLNTGVWEKYTSYLKRVSHKCFSDTSQNKRRFPKSQLVHLWHMCDMELNLAWNIFDHCTNIIVSVHCQEEGCMVWGNTYPEYQKISWGPFLQPMCHHFTCLHCTIDGPLSEDVFLIFAQGNVSRNTVPRAVFPNTVLRAQGVYYYKMWYLQITSFDTIPVEYQEIHPYSSKMKTDSFKINASLKMR